LIKKKIVRIILIYQLLSFEQLNLLWKQITQQLKLQKRIKKC